MSKMSISRTFESGRRCTWEAPDVRKKTPRLAWTGSHLLAAVTACHTIMDRSKRTLRNEQSREFHPWSPGKVSSDTTCPKGCLLCERRRRDQARCQLLDQLRLFRKLRRRRGIFFRAKAFCGQPSSLFLLPGKDAMNNQVTIKLKIVPACTRGAKLEKQQIWKPLFLHRRGNVTTSDL